MRPSVPYKRLKCREKWPNSVSTRADKFVLKHAKMTAQKLCANFACMYNESNRVLKKTILNKTKQWYIFSNRNS